MIDNCIDNNNISSNDSRHDDSMQPLPLCCDSSSSWVSISIFKPRKQASCTSDDLVASISSISKSFHKTCFVKSAVLKGKSSNFVAVYSIWEKVTTSDEPCEHPKVRHSRKLLDGLRFKLFRQRRRSYPPLLPLLQVDAYEKAISSVAQTVDVIWYEVSCWDSKERLPLPSSSLPPLTQGDNEMPSLSSSPSSSSSSSLSLPSFSSSLSPHLSLGDIVHLRGIVCSEADLQDVVSYSCLAILKAYFQKTDGLLSYSFYKSLDGSSMAGLGIWENFDAASAFLNAPDGAPEEHYWRSLGAKTRLGIYEVVSVTAD